MAKKYKINTRTGKFDLVGNGGGGGGDYSLRSPQQTIKVTETTSGHNVDVADELQTKIENAYQSSIGRRIHCGTGGKFEMFRISYAFTNSGRECSFQIVVRKLYTIVAVVEYTLIVGKTDQDGHNGDYIDFNYTVKYVKGNYNVENLICCERIQNHSASNDGVVVVFVNAAESNLMISYTMGARYPEVGEVAVASGTINYNNNGQPFTSSEDYVTATIFDQSSESEEAKINYYRVPVSFGTPQESIKIVGNTDSDSVDDGYILNSGQLMQIGDYYYLFYMGLASGETSETQYHILSAYSADGLTWQRGFPDGITPPVAGTNRLLSESGLIEHCIVEVPDSEYPYRLLCNKIASSSSQSMRLYKSSDGINYVFVGTILNEKHDSQMSAICKGDTIEVYTRIWDDAHTNRQVGSLTIDLNGNIVKSLHVVLGDNLYNSAAIAIDPHRELLFPTWYIGVSASTQQNAHLECYQMQGEKAIKLNTNIKQILADDEYWALVCPGVIAINGQKYIAVNAWKRHHYSVAGDVNKMETRLVPVSIDLTSTSAESSYYDDTVTQYGSDNVQGALEAIGANLGELDERVTDLEQGGSGGSVELIESITYANLVTKRNNSQLTKGKRYRITDYKTIIDYDGAETITDGQFDLIVLALSANTLSEQANAIWHDGDTYFEDSVLNSWKIGYVLDNSKDRQPLCDEENGKGCIYFMEDENGNTCSYDFKSIKWKREIDGEEKYYFTFSVVDDDDNIKDYSLCKSVYCYGNKLHSDYIECYEGDIYMNYDNVFINIYDDSYCYYNKFGNECYENTFGDGCHSNTLGNECYENTFGDGCHSNTFGNECYENTFGNECHSNTFGDSCQSNTLGNECFSNTFGDSCHSNTFGDRCQSNTFGDVYKSNTLGNECFSNTFGNSCQSNTLGNECFSNTFGDICHSNTFGDGCVFNAFGDICQSNTLGNSCIYNTFGDSCISNKFGNENCLNKSEDYLSNIDKSEESRTEHNTRRWYRDANGELQFEVMCYRS